MSFLGPSVLPVRPWENLSWGAYFPGRNRGPDFTFAGEEGLLIAAKLTKCQALSS